ALIAEEDGGIYACDHFVDTLHRRGTLGKDDFPLMVDGPEQRAFGLAKKSSLSSDCLRCPYISYCNGGCPKDRFAADSEGKQCRYYLCEGLRMLFSHADGILEKVMELSSKGMSPQRIMKQLRRA
ncbi:MAG: SPASM domain-containing protein, partial [Eubacteriaceae bacterium]|nr:SPASM domain-containing protein [Eubacteriaceae bacterium]